MRLNMRMNIPATLKNWQKKTQQMRALCVIDVRVISFEQSMWAERERSGSGRSSERERSGERAKSAAQNPLHHKNHSK